MTEFKNEKIKKIINCNPFKITDSKYYFLDKESANIDNANSVKDWFKKRPEIYKFLVFLFGPVFLFNGLKKRDLFKKVSPKENIVIDLGSGPDKENELIKIDQIPFAGVDVVADISNLPIKDNSIDGIICQSVLEHVKNPDSLISEVYRILKPGGYALIVAPFLEGYHSAPEDYNRWTKKGLKHLLNKFEIVDYRICGGPFSAIVWTLHESLAILLSFGIDGLYQFLKIIFMIVLAPLKYLDFIFSWYKKSHYITTNHSFLVKRK